MFFFQRRVIITKKQNSKVWKKNNLDKGRSVATAFSVVSRVRGVFWFLSIVIDRAERCPAQRVSDKWPTPSLSRAPAGSEREQEGSEQQLRGGAAQTGGCRGGKESPSLPREPSLCSVWAEVRGRKMVLQGAPGAPRQLGVNPCSAHATLTLRFSKLQASAAAAHWASG